MSDGPALVRHTALTFNGQLIDVGMLRTTGNNMYGLVMAVGERQIEVFGLSRVELAALVRNEDPLTRPVRITVEFLPPGEG